MADGRGGGGGGAAGRSPEAAMMYEVCDTLLGDAGDLLHLQSGEWHSPIGSHTSIDALFRNPPPRLPYRIGGRVQGLVAADSIGLPNSELSMIIDCDHALPVQICYSKIRNEDSKPLLMPMMIVTLGKPLFVHVGNGRPMLVLASPAEIHVIGLGSESGLLRGNIPNPSPRTQGNMYFQQEMYMLACISYKGFLPDAMSRDRNSWEKVARMSNRAQASLNLGMVDVAVLAAGRALEIDPGHVKSLFRKARGLLAMGEYTQALECMEKLKNIPQMEAERERCRILREQSSTGDYDAYLREKSTAACADFVGPVVVNAGQHGRGLFLTGDVKRDQLLLVSNAIAAVDESAASVEDLTVELLRACRYSSKALAQVKALGDPGKIPAMEIFKPNSSWALDRALLDCQGCCVDMDVWKVRDLVDVAGCSCYPVEGEELLTGVWGLPGLINHSCSANVTRSCVGRAMFVRAARDMSAGEELLCSYTCSGAPWSAVRKEGCFGRRKFYCGCERCEAERKYERLLEGVGWSEDAAESLGVVSRLEEAVRDLPDEEKRLIRAGYVLAYINCSLDDLCKLRGCPKPKELLVMLDEVMPGIEEGSKKKRLKSFVEKLLKVEPGTLVDDQAVLANMNLKAGTT